MSHRVLLYSNILGWGLFRITLSVVVPKIFCYNTVTCRTLSIQGELKVWIHLVKFYLRLNFYNYNTTVTITLCELILNN